MSLGCENWYDPYFHSHALEEVIYLLISIAQMKKGGKSVCSRSSSGEVVSPNTQASLSVIKQCFSPKLAQPLRRNKF